jgi:hypothetical protein
MKINKKREILKKRVKILLLPALLTKKSVKKNPEVIFKREYTMKKNNSIFPK